MRIVIIDDEKCEQDLIELYLCEWLQINGMAVDINRYKSSEQFLFTWEADKAFDLIVLDIEMGQMNGMELAKKIRQENEDIPLLFVTGYDEYMQYGYDVSALNYLIKPVNKERLFIVLDKLDARRGSIGKEKLQTTTDRGARNILVSNIMYIEANGHECNLYCQSEKIIVKEALSIIENRLKPYPYFVKCHRAYIVNMSYVSMILKTDVILDNNEHVPVSRNELKNVRTLFMRYYTYGDKNKR